MLEHPELSTNPVAEDRPTRLQEIQDILSQHSRDAQNTENTTVIDYIFKWEIEYGSYKVP